jgi:hypothetical protein
MRRVIESAFYVLLVVIMGWELWVILQMCANMLGGNRDH